ncbi:hypothetical protein BUALT_Bualt10G0070400 [Buddleja alternifolia]|uniref:Uncharacterized protein n=1 Tax=Buddleja alternifolia TaxID=168488 RepID=A0AAV6WWQ3_9LAMI|nr:hypothetical protein BUALT_Bualt10G0070400 [Buddleja alternifolia]
MKKRCIPVRTQKVEVVVEHGGDERAGLWWFMATRTVEGLRRRTISGGVTEAMSAVSDHECVKTSKFSQNPIWAFGFHPISHLNRNYVIVFIWLILLWCVFLIVKDEREVLPTSSEATTAATIATAASTSAHGIEIAVEFKPVERPNEPLDNDRPIQCPLPEPSILNDGRIWKERVSSGIQRRADIPVMQEQTRTDPETLARKTRPPSNRAILPSMSAPEHNLLKLLDECNASGI